MLVIRRAGVVCWRLRLLGVGVWLAILVSGVHATIAGVVLGLLAPARPLRPPARPGAGRDLSDEPAPPSSTPCNGSPRQRLAGRAPRAPAAPVDQLRHRTRPSPWPTPASSSELMPSTPRATVQGHLGHHLGLVAGKPLGVTGARGLPRAAALRLPAGAPGRRSPASPSLPASASPSPCSSPSSPSTTPTLAPGRRQARRIGRIPGRRSPRYGSAPPCLPAIRRGLSEGVGRLAASPGRALCLPSCCTSSRVVHDVGACGEELAPGSDCPTPGPRHLPKGRGPAIRPLT